MVASMIGLGPHEMTEWLCFFSTATHLRGVDPRKRLSRGG